MKAFKMLTLSLILMLSGISFASQDLHEDGLRFQPKDDWVQLGSRVVNMQAEHDEIIVTVTKGAFTKLRLKVMKAPIHLLNINIIFGNGTNKNVVFNKKFAPGTFTRIIDLPGNKRIIKKVKLNYKSVPVGKGRAVVTLFGKH
ncbi:MAG: hypothetical protein HUJ25_05855 [Crocinitomicaceae bacterium]|nr:hypothetical protein [Crocinitomicaceae bacterium]